MKVWFLLWAPSNDRHEFGIANTPVATAFTVGTSHTYDTDTSPSECHVLCTNSAPLTRSNVTSRDTSHQIKFSTPSAGVLRGSRDKFSVRFLYINFAGSTVGAVGSKPPISL
jgi:hypothetical protein